MGLISNMGVSTHVPAPVPMPTANPFASKAEPTIVKDELPFTMPKTQLIPNGCRQSTSDKGHTCGKTSYDQVMEAYNAEGKGGKIQDGYLCEEHVRTKHAGAEARKLRLVWKSTGTGVPALIMGEILNAPPKLDPLPDEAWAKLIPVPCEECGKTFDMDPSSDITMCKSCTLDTGFTEVTCGEPNKIQEEPKQSEEKILPDPTVKYKAEDCDYVFSIDKLKSMYIPNDKDNALDLMPKWLEEIFEYDMNSYRLTERKQGVNPIVIAHYFIGSCDWYITEYDPDNEIMFGFCSLYGDPWRDHNAEWGSVSLEELKSISVPCKVERETFSFTPGLTLEQTKAKGLHKGSKVGFDEPKGIPISPQPPALAKAQEEALRNPIKIYEVPLYPSEQSIPRDDKTTQTVETRMDKLEANFDKLMEMMTDVLKATKEPKRTRSVKPKEVQVPPASKCSDNLDLPKIEEVLDCACGLHSKKDQDMCYWCATKLKIEAHPLLPTFSYNENGVVTNPTELALVEIEKNFVKVDGGILKDNKWLFGIHWSCGNAGGGYSPSIGEGEAEDVGMKRVYIEIYKTLTLEADGKGKTCMASKLLTKLNNHIAFEKIAKQHHLNQVMIASTPNSTPTAETETKVESVSDIDVGIKQVSVPTENINDEASKVFDGSFNLEDNANLSKNIQKEIDSIRSMKQTLTEETEQDQINVQLVEASPYEASIVYPIRDRLVSKDSRELANYKSLDGKLINEETYQSYSGKGGLHGIDFKECDSFHDYTSQKKEFELGQFFTPDWLCKQMVEVIQPEKGSEVCDLTCGAGRFFNFLKDCCVRGNESDDEAYAIACKLFGDSHIYNRHILYFSRLSHSCDYAVGNPPFNLVFDDSSYYTELQSTSGKLLSQDVYVAKNLEVLKDGGGFIFIVPNTWLNNELAHSKINAYIDDNFYRIGEFSLPLDTFREYEVEFPTKVVFLIKKLDGVTYPYAPLKMEWSSFILNIDYFDEYKWFIGLKKFKLSISARLNLQSMKQQAKANDIVALEDSKISKTKYKIAQLYKQKDVKDEKLDYILESFDKDIRITRKASKPSWMKPDEWARKKPTISKVLKKFTNRVARVPTKELFMRVTHSSKDIKIMPSNNTVAHYMKQNGISRSFDKHYLITDRAYPKTFESYSSGLDNALLKLKRSHVIETGSGDTYLAREIKVIHDFDPIKYLEAKAKEVLLDRADTTKLEELYPKEYNDNKDLLSELTFKDNKLGEISLLPHQVEDLAGALIKNKVLLAWDTGLGKSLAGLVWCLQKGGRSLIVCPSVNVLDPWNKELKERFDNASYFIIKNKKQVHRIKDEQFIVCSLEIMPLVYKQLAKIKFNNILLDESDNIKNKASIRAKALKSMAKNIKNKIIMTGTPTRNNALEIYNQAEFLFNNGPSMLCTAKEYVKYDRSSKEYRVINNPLYMIPFPAYGGYANFQDSFSPKKLTVFGAEKTNQDIYNKDGLNDFLIGFRFARLFDEEKPRINEILGIESGNFDGGYQLHQQSIPMNEHEKEVYEYILTVFAKEMEEYYRARHDGAVAKMLTIVRQIFKLLAGVSHPWTIPVYKGPEETTKMHKASEIFTKSSAEGRKVLFGSPWVPTVDHYANYFAKNFVIFKLEQAMSSKKRQEIINEYKSHVGSAILMGTMALLKSGLNIPEASVVVTDSFSWNFAGYKQFIARAVRLNSIEKVQVHALMNEGSFDLNVFALMLKKEKVNQYIRQGITTGDTDLMADFDVNQELFNQAMQMVKTKVDGHILAKIEWSSESVFTN